MRTKAHYDAPARPQELGHVRVLMLTPFESDSYVMAALRAGASGFLGKGVHPEELLASIRVVPAGESSLSPEGRAV